MQQMQQMQQWQKMQQMQRMQQLQKMQSLVGGPIGRAGVQMVRYQNAPNRPLMRPQGSQMMQGKVFQTENIRTKIKSKPPYL